MPGTHVPISSRTTSQRSEIIGTAPELRFTETDQTDPAGRWRIVADGNGIQAYHALTAGWASSSLVARINPESSVEPGYENLGWAHELYGRLSILGDNIIRTIPTNGIAQITHVGVTAAATGLIGAGIQARYRIESTNTQNWTASPVGLALFEAGGAVLEDPGVGGAYTLTGLAAFYAMADTIGANTTVTNHYGLYVENTASTGTMTNQYGVYIEDLTSGASDYGIYIAGADSTGLYVAGDNWAINTLGPSFFNQQQTDPSNRIAVESRLTTVLTGDSSGLYSAVSGRATISSTNAGSLTRTPIGIAGVTGYYDAPNGVTGARTITGAAAFYAPFSLNAPVGTNLTVTNLYGLYVANPAAIVAGTLTNLYGIYIEDLTTGGTLDVGLYIAGADTAAIWVASADPILLGTAGTATGVLQIAGATSGVVSVTVNATAGTWTLTLPADDGTNGQFLQTNGSGVTTWATVTSYTDAQAIAAVEGEATLAFTQATIISTTTGDLTLSATANVNIPDDKLFVLGTTADQVFLNRSTVLAADTALAGVLVGTVVGSRQALAANSLIVANVTSFGDMGFYVNRGDGNSYQFLRSGADGLVDIGMSFIGITEQVQIVHRDTTNTASHAALVVKANNTSADAYVSVQTAATQWYMGVDNSDSDSLVFGTGVGVGTNSLLTLTTSGGLTITGSVYLGSATSPINGAFLASSAGVARFLSFNISISAGGAANAVLQHSFELDSTAEAGLLSETDGSGSYTQAKTIWKVPYRDSGVNVAAPTDPTTAATWLGGLRVEAGNDANRLYLYANEAWHYINQTAGFSFLHKEPTTFGDFNNWKYGDLIALKVDRYNENGGHALPYPFRMALKDEMLALLDVDAEFRQQVKEKLYA